MNKYLCVLALAAVLVVVSCEKTYRAAVVEYYANPIKNHTAGAIVTKQVASTEMLKNLAVYETFVKDAAMNDTDIIVFPENGLFPADIKFDTRDEIYPYLEVVPDPYDPNNAGSLNPCADPSAFEEAPVLRAASCLAQKYNITLVFDMGSVVPCTLASDPLCPSDGRWQFNTQVAFSNEGELIGRYHKRHLYYEPQYNPSPYPNFSTFKTNFGVEFGMLICFDLLFHEPSHGLADGRKVVDIVYSTSWVNDPPVPLANAIQQGYSRAYDLNLIASQNDHRAYLSSGMGIFSQGNALATYFNNGETYGSSMLIADVPILQPLSDRLEQEPIISHSNLIDEHSYQLPRDIGTSWTSLFATPGLPFKAKPFPAAAGDSGSISLELKHEFQCNFTYTISKDTDPSAIDTYFAMALDAREIPNALPAPAYGCMIGMCINQNGDRKCDLKDIAYVQSQGALFSSFSITGTFKDKDVVLPAVSTSTGGLVSASALKVGSIPSASDSINIRMEVAPGQEVDVLSAMLIQVLE